MQSVVQLQQERGEAAGQTLEEHRLPGRACVVEGCHGDLLGICEELPPAPTLGEPDVPD